MSKLDTELTVTFDNDYGRPCLIPKPTKNDDHNKEKAMFHKWVIKEDPVPPRFNNSKNPLPWGQRSVLIGLVEYEDGQLDMVYPDAITFVDGKVSRLFAEGVAFRDKDDSGYPKHIEEFIKSCSFTVTHTSGVAKYITVKRFIEALEEYFNYKWDEEVFHMSIGSPSETTVEEFIYDGSHFENLGRPISSARDRVISLEWAKRTLKRYFNYEWSDEIYDKY